MELEERIKILEQKIKDLGYTSIYIEFLPKNKLKRNKELIYVKVYFNFKFKYSDEVRNGRQEFETDTEDNILIVLKDFMSIKDKGNWVLC